MCKKGLSVLVLLSLWMCLTGFASLGEEGKDTWNSMMEQLSAEEIDQLLAEENEWYGKVMANVEDSVTIRAEASADSAAVGKMFKGDAGEILKGLKGSFDMIFMDAAKGQYIHWLPDVLRLMHKGSILVSDNVLQEGDIIESHYLVERRNRTIYKRMRQYLYELKHNPLLETSILPLGDGAAISVKKEESYA